MPPTVPARRWCVTLFQDEFEYNNLQPEWIHVRYIVGQREICPETGRKHYQLYVELKRGQRLPWLQRVVFNGVRCRAEAARGTQAECIEYCTKERTRDPDEHHVEYGEPSRGAGSRTDLSELRDRMRDAYATGGRRAAWAAAYDSHFSAAIAYTRGLEAYLSSLGGHRQGPVDAPLVEVHEGPTGVGKSHHVWTTAPGVYPLPPTRPGAPVWFPGYAGQEDVLIDDYDGESITLTYMLRLLDKYPLDVEVKGAHVPWNAKRIFITTNVPVREWYASAREEHRSALHRRISGVYRWTQDRTKEFLPRSEWDLTSIVPGFAPTYRPHSSS